MSSILRWFGEQFGFRERYTVARIPDADPLSVASGSPLADEWSLYAARRMRYDMGWAFDDNSAYRDIHGYARSHKDTFRLYKAIRCIYSPANRLNTFHAGHIMGGPLDQLAGDGKMVRSSIPIETLNESIRPGIAKLWRDSRWQTRKGTWVRWGAAMGDVGLRVVTDYGRRRVRLRAVHPRGLEWVGTDPEDPDCLTGYIYHEMRYDPELGTPTVGVDGRAIVAGSVAGLDSMVRYTERVILDDATGDVTYETFRRGVPHAWPGSPGDTWTVPYGFIPLRLAQHAHSGLAWGKAEYWDHRSKITEADDVASKISDQIRRMLEGTWIFSGVETAADISFDDDDEEDETSLRRRRPNSGDRDRAKLKVIALTDPQARAHVMAGDLKIDQATAYLLEIIHEIERDLPELDTNIWRASDPSGVALRIARARAEDKVDERRSGYDDVLSTVQGMALAIGGHGLDGSAFPGYEPYSLDQWHADDSPLAHRIGERPVFAEDEEDQWRLKKQKYDTLRVAVSAGIPLPWAMLNEFDMTEEQVKEIEDAQVADAARANPDGTLASQTVVKEALVPPGTAPPGATGPVQAQQGSGAP